MMLLVPKHGFKDCPGFLNSTGRLGPKRGRKCYVTPAFSGVPNKGGQNQKSKRTLGVTMMLLVPKRGFKDCPGFLNSTGRLGPKRGRKCYVTPAFSGVPNKGGQNQKSKRTLGVTMMLLVPKRGFKDCPGFLNSTGRLGPKRGRKCYVTPAFSRVPNKGGQNQKSKRTLGVTMMLLVPKRGFKDCPGFLNSTGRLGPKRGRKCYVTPAFSGVPNKGGQNQKSKRTLGVTMMLLVPKHGFKDCPGFLNSTGRLGPKRGRKCYVTPASSRVPNKGGQNQKSKRTLGVTMMLLVPKHGFKDCPGFLNSTGRLGPKRGRKCYVTPAFSGVPNKGGQNQKSKRTLGVTMMLLVPKHGFKDCPGFLNSTGRLGPKRGRKCYVTPAFSRVPNKGGQNQKSKRTLGVTMMLLVPKRGFKDCPGFLNSTGRLGPKRGRKCYVTPAFSGVPNKGGQNQKSKCTLGVTMMLLVPKHGFKDCPGFLNSTGRLGPKRGRKCYVTPAFSGVPNKGGQNQKSKRTLGVTMMLLVPKRGFKDCPGFLNSTGRLGPKRGRKCYVTPAFSRVPNKGGQNQKSKRTLGVTMMLLVPKHGFKDCPGFLNSTGRLGPKRGRKCYVTPASSRVPNKGGQNQKSQCTLGVTMMLLVPKRGFKDCPGFLNSTGRLGPKRGRKCYVTPASSGVPNKGGQNQKSKRTLGVTMMLLVPKHGFKDCPGFLNSTGRLGPKRGRKCYVTPAFSRVPNKGGQNQKSKRTLGVTMMLLVPKRGFKDCPGFLNSTGRLGPKRGRKCYVTPAFSGVPNKGGQNQKSKRTLGVTMMLLVPKRGFKDCPGFLNSTGRLGPKRGRKCYVTPASSRVPNKGGQNQKSKRTLGVTMMLLVPKRGFKDCPGFLNSTGRLGPKRGRKCYVTPAFSRVPNKGGQNQKSKRTLGVTMMLLVPKHGFKDCPGFLNSTGRLGPKRGRKCYVTPAFSGVPNKGGQNQKSKRTLGVTMMLLVPKRGFKDCPGFLNSTGRLGPKRGRKCYVTPASSQQRGTKSDVTTYARGHHDAPSTKAWIRRLSRFPQ